MESAPTRFSDGCWNICFKLVLDTFVEDKANQQLLGMMAVFCLPWMYCSQVYLNTGQVGMQPGLHQPIHARQNWLFCSEIGRAVKLGVPAELFIQPFFGAAHDWEAKEQGECVGANSSDTFSPPTSHYQQPHRTGVKLAFDTETWELEAIEGETVGSEGDAQGPGAVDRLLSATPEAGKMQINREREYACSGLHLI